VWFIAGLFVLLAVPISAYGVQGHMEHYSRPTLQKHVVRILWMPCVYGLDAWLALRFKVRALELARGRLRTALRVRMALSCTRAVAAAARHAPRAVHSRRCDAGPLHLL
jgi:hypothetical protein